MTHTIARTPILPMHEWWMLAVSVSKAINHINGPDPVVYGPFGNGPPIITDAIIRFNGNELAHQWARQQRQRGLAVDIHGRDTHEDFTLPRVAPTTLTTGYYFHTTVTKGKPYSVAIRVTYLLTRHYFPDNTLVIAAGNADANEWNRALIFARATVPDILLPQECSRKPPRDRPRLSQRAPQFAPQLAVHV